MRQGLRFVNLFGISYAWLARDFELGLQFKVRTARYAQELPEFSRA